MKLPHWHLHNFCINALNTYIQYISKCIWQLQIGSLIIESAKKRDTGNYTCSPSNSPSATVSLNIINGKWTWKMTRTRRRFAFEAVNYRLLISDCRRIICIGGNVSGPNHSGVYSMHSGTAAQRHRHWQRSEHMTSWAPQQAGNDIRNEMKCKKHRSWDQIDIWHIETNRVHVVS